MDRESLAEEAGSNQLERKESLAKGEGHCEWDYALCLELF